MTLKKLSVVVHNNMKHTGLSKTASEDIARALGEEVIDLIQLDALAKNPRKRPACADFPMKKVSNFRRPHRESMRDYLTYWIPNHLLPDRMTSAAYLGLLKYCESKVA